MKDKAVIGLTGPTGAGKTTVAAAFRTLGCAVVDADRIARDESERAEYCSAVRRAFGGCVFRRDGGLDRQALADLAFSSPENTDRLNAATHPVILAECRRQLETAKHSPCRAAILDAPLLFESGADRLCGATIAVLTPDIDRLTRIMSRDRISGEAARRRMSVQHDNGYYRDRADYLFDGNLRPEALRTAASSLLDRILKELNEKAAEKT